MEESANSRQGCRAFLRQDKHISYKDDECLHRVHVDFERGGDGLMLSGCANERQKNF